MLCFPATSLNMSLNLRFSYFIEICNTMKNLEFFLFLYYLLGLFLSQIAYFQMISNLAAWPQSVNIHLILILTCYYSFLSLFKNYIFICLFVCLYSQGFSHHLPSLEKSWILLSINITILFWSSMQKMYSFVFVIEPVLWFTTNTNLTGKFLLPYYSSGNPEYCFLWAVCPRIW